MHNKDFEVKYDDVERHQTAFDKHNVKVKKTKLTKKRDKDLEIEEKIS